MTQSKINLIYIVGSGHCGSTLLDLIIGSAPEVFTLGELGFFNIYKEHLNHNKKKASSICTCKTDFHTCHFWKTVKDKQEFSIKKQFSSSETMRILFSIFSPLYTRPSEQYPDDTFDLLDTINTHYFGREHAPSYYVDSSKDPRRLYYLLNDSRLNVFPIFLKKNGVSVAHSYSKYRPNLKQKNFYVSYVLRWMLVNKTARGLLKNTEHSVISYEDFCETPLAYFSSLNEQLGINIPMSSMEELLHTVNNTTYHSIDGNALRFYPITTIKRHP
jgi:sulfur transfer complex TusBCD TusB component (DsrH family)